jgi:hypothetical protein
LPWNIAIISRQCKMQPGGKARMQDNANFYALWDTGGTPVLGCDIGKPPFFTGDAGFLYKVIRMARPFTGDVYAGKVE